MRYLVNNHLQEFVEETIRYLWTKTSASEAVLVRRRALAAIAKFPVKDHQLKMMPEVVRIRLIFKTQTLRSVL